MRIETYNDPMIGPHVTVVLSRRNLKSLLAKLDGNPPDSKLTIERAGWALGGEPTLVVKAEEDDVHYADRGYGPGPMHADTEAAL